MKAIQWFKMGIARDECLTIVTNYLCWRTGLFSETFALKTFLGWKLTSELRIIISGAHCEITEYAN
jgi:hypothetical protein